MALVSGARVGPYEVVSPLGAGGMGEVYRARDTRLERLVALKILSTSGASPRQIERFHREARAISRVEHRHICTLHDIGQHDGLVFLVMELLEGETLATRLEQGRMPLDRALAIGAEIADALDAAHRQGLIHRDLKPSNVMLTRSGVKLLDFGIAKLREVEVDADARQPTSTVALTEEGTVVGTLPYMSPEQVEGKEVDGRTDIFALGVVLYEVITGRRPFNGDTRASLAAAILTFDPPVVSSLSTLATPAVDRLTRKCLAKDPDERWQTARDLASELRWLRQDSGPQTVSPSADVVRPTRRRYSMWLAGAALVAIVTALSLSGLFARGPKADPPTAIPRWLPITFRAGTVSSARFAPDGDTVVYSAAWDGRPYTLYTTRRGSPESRALEVAGARLGAISNSGEIAFIHGSHSAGRLFRPTWRGTVARVSLAGGAVRDLSEGIMAAAWAPGEAALVVVRGGGQVEWPLGNVIYTSRARLRSLRVAPAGDRVALVEGGTVIVLDRSGSKTTLSTGLATEFVSLAWSPDGTEVWFSGVRDLTEPPLKAVSLSGQERVLANTPPGPFTLEDVFRDGRVLVARHTVRNGLSCLSPRETQMRELAWLDASMPEALSADGRTVVFGENGLGGRAATGAGPLRAATYLRPTNGSDAIRLSEGYPEDLSPDGAAVLVSIRQGHPLRWVIVPTGSGEPRTLPPGPFDSIGEANFLPDGKRIAFAAREPDHGERIYIQELGDQPPRVISPEGVGTNGLSTPDGRFVLGISISGGQTFLYPVDGGDARPLTSLAAHEEPLQWSRDGRRLYVRNTRTWPPSVDRIDVTSGRRQAWKVMFPVDPVGVEAVPRILITPDGTSYCFDYYRVFSELFVVEGIK